jgi:predicted TIM-barrel fold metal-dependent hydrolase
LHACNNVTPFARGGPSSTRECVTFKHHRHAQEAQRGRHRRAHHGAGHADARRSREHRRAAAEKWGVSAWKTYTQYGPDGKGYFPYDEVGIRFIEKARALGVKNVCIHKGFPFGSRSYEHSQCSDIGVVAKRYPDVNFLVYHSGFVSAVTEKAYDPSGKSSGQS